MPKESISIKKKVLVVEDDQGVAMMLRFCFHSAGFEVSEAPAGREALLSLAKESPDAVVLDLGFPDQMGGAVLEWLRKGEQKGSGSPAWVVISALDQGDVVRQYGTMEGHFLSKPFNPWELVRTLEGLLSTTGSRTPSAQRKKA